jgi:site-specific DNA-methyltransferase (adenine-specific)
VKPRLNNGLFTGRTDDWATPQPLFDMLNSEFGFTLDPCASANNHKCARFFTESDNGLLQSWACETVWMNPPYGTAIGEWMKKAYMESRRGATVVCLIPARTDTRYWHSYAMRAHEIRFIKGRVTFGDAISNAPFPSALVIFRPTVIRTFEVAPFIGQMRLSGGLNLEY